MGFRGSLYVLALGLGLTGNSFAAGTPCSCVGQADSKKYEYDEQLDRRRAQGESINFSAEKGTRTNFSFYCNYTCVSKSGNSDVITRALHVRTSRPGREPPEPEMRCGGLHYGFQDNPNEPGRPIPEAPVPRSKPVDAKSDDSFFGFLGIGRDEFDSQKVIDWAKANGCR